MGTAIEERALQLILSVRPTDCDPGGV